MKKRTVTLVALGLAGLSLLFLGWRGGLLQKKDEIPGTQVSRPATVTMQPVSGRDRAAESGARRAGDEGSDFFVEYRLERERARGQRVEWLREVINNAGSTSETRQKAQEHLMAISRNMAREVELENLIRAKGFKDAAVLVDDRAVTVIVAAAGLTGGEAAGITELVSRSTGVDAQNVVIITRASP
ncbi:MAG: SpoIIIAH-like family protein [Peptococcaceae bacterium]|nr:SpoIIIAH-like family protein [Peptococcaceae bacterium]